jgi:hypothetical protein
VFTLISFSILCSANIRATVSVKLVSQVGVGVVAAGVAKAHAGNSSRQVEVLSVLTTNITSRHH